MDQGRRGQRQAAVGLHLDADGSGRARGHRRERLCPGALPDRSLHLPAGYALDATSHSFIISADALDYAFTASFTNSKTTVPLLPLTGGMGADAFLLTGAALGVVALVAAYVRRRRSQTVQ